MRSLKVGTNSVVLCSIKPVVRHSRMTDMFGNKLGKKEASQRVASKLKIFFGQKPQGEYSALSSLIVRRTTSQQGE